MATERRFFESSTKDINNLKDISKCENTKRSTKEWLKVFTTWAQSRGQSPKTESYEPSELNKTLEQFYTEVRKTNGDEYEPDSLNVMLAALDRHLKEVGFQFRLDLEENLLRQRTYWKVKRDSCDPLGKEKSHFVQRVLLIKKKMCCGKVDSWEIIILVHYWTLFGGLWFSNLDFEVVIDSTIYKLRNLL